MDITVLKSNKGHNKLIIDGYDYHLQSKSKKNLYRWCCAKRKELLCKATVTTDFINGLHAPKNGPSIHNHDPSAFKKHVTQANNVLKEMSSSSSLQPCQIIREAVISCQPNCRVYLPSKRAQKEKIGRIRRTHESYNEPNSLDTIKIPEEILFLEDELFVLSEKRFNDEMIIILGTTTSLTALAKAECWLMDGTFYIVPSIMRQLFSIHGKVGDQIVPLVFCLMSSKSKNSYSEFFYELHKLAVERNISLAPKIIITDFEKSISSAARSYFPSATFKGCLFHFGQIIWRRTQKEGLAVEYGNNENLNLQIRMLKSLSFIPHAEIPKYYSELSSTFQNESLQNLGFWFKKNYISGESKQMKPKYDPAFWSVVDLVKENYPRTQNSVEAWHRRLKVVVGKKHSGLYAIIKEMGKEMILVKTTLEKISSGEIISPKKSHIQKYKKIKRLMKKREEIGLIEYLKSIAYYITLC